MEEFKLHAHVTLFLKLDAKGTKHEATEIRLEEPNYAKNQLMDSDSELTKMGSQAITQCFIQGLLANIDLAQEKGFRNDAEHLRYIIAELEKGFVKLVDGGYVKE